MTRWFLTAGSVLIAAACYDYKPLTVTPVPPSGLYVAATLTDSGAQALASYLGPDARVVRGRSLGTTDGGLQLSVTGITTGRGEELTWHGETVTLPLPLIATLQERRSAKGRTAMLIGLSIAAMVGAAAGFSLIGSGDSPGQGSGPPGKH